MDKTLKIILWILSIIVIIDGGVMLFTFQTAVSWSDFGAFVAAFIAVTITLLILSIVLTVATLGALIRKEYEDPAKRKYFFKLLAATIAVDALVVFYSLKIFF